MDARCPREVSIGALTHRLLDAVTSILFRAVAKMICPIRELKAADVARISSWKPGPSLVAGSAIMMRRITAEKVI